MALTSSFSPLPFLAAALLALPLAGAQHAGHAAPATATPASGSPGSSVGKLPLKVGAARVIAVPPGIKETSLILTLTNTSSKAVVISSVSGPVAGHSMLMKTVVSGKLTGMQTVPTLTVPARGTLKMTEVDDHVMLMALKRPLKVGEVLPFTLKAKDGRTLTVSATVKKP